MLFLPKEIFLISKIIFIFLCNPPFNFIEAVDKSVLDSEEAAFDEHMNRVSEIIEWLEQLEDLAVTTKSVMPHVFDKGNHRPEVRLITEAEHLSWRLSQVQDSLKKVNRVVEERETGMRLLEKHKDKLKRINTDLQGKTHNMQLINDESLAEKATGLAKASFGPWVAIKRLLKNIKNMSTASKEKGLSGAKLPQVSVPTFDGKVLNWKRFWE